MEVLNTIFLVCAAVALPAQIALYSYMVQMLLPRLLTRASAGDDALHRFFRIRLRGRLCAVFRNQRFQVAQFPDGGQRLLQSKRGEFGGPQIRMCMFGEAVFLLVMLSWFMMTPPAKAHTT